MSQELRREIQEVWALFKETDEKFKETDKTIERMVKTVEEVSRNVGALTSKWGKFVEGLVAPGAVRMFKERGIKVKQTYTRAESQKNGEEMEIDVIAISVKSTLKVEDVNEHMDDLSRFREFFPNFADRKLLGAVAGIVIEKATKGQEEADQYAYRKGLFVITKTGETVKILNDEKFKPRLW